MLFIVVSRRVNAGVRQLCVSKGLIMKKRYKLIALIITLTIGIIIYRLLLKPHAWLSTSSPNETYTVELTGDKSRPSFLAIEHEVDFNVLKNGNRFIENARAHSGDWMDISFELAYPEHAWINENVLRFWRNPERPDKAAYDTMLIFNETGKTIRYFRINSKDMFLVFDMQPNSTIKLSPSSQSGLSWVTCEGEFEDGQHITCNGVNFSHEDKENEPLKYCVSVDYSRVKIESSQSSGYDINGNWKIPNVPKSASCNP